MQHGILPNFIFFHDVNSEVAPINNPNPINIHLLINLEECGTYGTLGTYGTTSKNLNLVTNAISEK